MDVAGQGLAGLPERLVHSVPRRFREGGARDQQERECARKSGERTE